jgi:hypothetical protein
MLRWLFQLIVGWPRPEPPRPRVWLYESDLCYMTYHLYVGEDPPERYRYQYIGPFASTGAALEMKESLEKCLEDE